jgi:hypothetical protein
MMMMITTTATIHATMLVLDFMSNAPWCGFVAPDDNPLARIGGSGCV